MRGGMSQLQQNHSSPWRPSLAWNLGLPAGIRQVDCDGRTREPAEANADQLWSACDARRQESILNRFVDAHVEHFRDVLLDAQDACEIKTASSDNPPEALLGKSLWAKWIGYRDRTLLEMSRRGDLSSI